jgi:hypothetical protein
MLQQDEDTTTAKVQHWIGLDPDAGVAKLYDFSATIKHG